MDLQIYGERRSRKVWRNECAILIYFYPSRMVQRCCDASIPPSSNSNVYSSSTPKQTSMTAEVFSMGNVTTQRNHPTMVQQGRLNFLFVQFDPRVAGSDISKRGSGSSMSMGILVEHNIAFVFDELGSSYSAHNATTTEQ
jgi:hypothetical protein